MGNSIPFLFIRSPFETMVTFVRKRVLNRECPQPLNKFPNEQLPGQDGGYGPGISL